MATIQCLKCGKIIQVPDNWERSATCSNCNGSFREIQKTYQPPYYSPNQPYPNYPQQQNNQNWQVPNIRRDNTNIYNQFQELGQGMRNNMPHLIIGKNKPMPNQNYPNQPVQQPIFEKPSKSRQLIKWVFWIAVSVVIGYVVYKLVFGGALFNLFK